MAENERHLTDNSADTADGCSLFLELPENDPLFDKKKVLLEAVGFDINKHFYFESSSSADGLNSVLELMIQKARIISMDEVDLYFAVGDVLHAAAYCSFRNELEALHSVLSLINNRIMSCENVLAVLQVLRKSTLDMIYGLGSKIRYETTIFENINADREKRLLQWGQSNGVGAKLYLAYVQGAGRGAIAREDLEVGDVALDIPVSVIISEDVVYESDMFTILENINGISSDTMLLLWSMKEKHNGDSRFRVYFDTLPEAFNTGLSFGIDAIMALDGTLLLEEIVQAKEHLRLQYDALFPSLSSDHPDIFPMELYSWDQFLWACELWYSNGMKVMFPDGKIRTCLIPVAGFLNHSVCPHIIHYGKVDSTTKSLKFPLSRPCKAGEQCFLSYGHLSESHLVTFYGFLTQGDNSIDVIPLDIDVAQGDSLKDGSLVSNWTSHMVRGTWLSKNHGIFHYGLPSPLLDELRRSRNPLFRTVTDTHVNLEIELEILDDLRSTFEDMIETHASPNDRKHCCWDVNLALEFKDLQRRIISSIVASCYAGSKLVEQELCKCKN